MSSVVSGHAQLEEPSSSLTASCHKLHPELCLAVAPVHLDLCCAVQYLPRDLHRHPVHVHV